MSKSSDRPDNDQGDQGAPDRAAAAGAAPVQPRRERYLVAPAMPLAGTAFAQLDSDPGITVRRVIRATQGDGAGLYFPDVAVVEMDADRAARLAATPLLHVEPDLPLQYAEPNPIAGLSFADPGLVPFGAAVTVPFQVRGSDGAPLVSAEVYVISPTLPVRGVTGADGTAELALPAAALHTVTGVYVKPRFDHWAVWLARPDLVPGTPHAITCPRLSDTFTDFPAKELDAWARQAMRFDALPPTFRGHGVRIAVVDSGAAIDHPDLAGRVAAGRDIAGQEVPGPNDRGWRVDLVGHGSHCAGIIGGSDNGAGIVGVVPEAELHACRIFPGGHFSDLIEALDYCIAQQIDVVNLSLGNAHPSDLLAAKIEQARWAGVACVAAAGNSAGPVAFPARLPTVLAVAAIGKMGEFPPGSYHATQVAGAPTPEGYFSAKFTCFGPEIDVCAPGVAIVSCVPPVNYAAWDGTSFAAPYVAALAGLLLAHHPEFRERFATRSAARVDRLFELIRSNCQPLALGDPGRTGAGLPDAVRALGLMPPVSLSPPAHPLLASLWQAMAHAGLIPAPVPIATPAMATAHLGAAGGAFTRPTPGAAFTTCAGAADDALAPLRTAMRAAGLLGPEDPQSGAN